jgi:ABC-2 type transport system permease protein
VAQGELTMRALFRNEVLKTYFRWRSYIAFIAIAVVVPLVLVAMKLNTEAMTRSVTRGLSQDFLFVGNILNGYFVTYLLLNALWIHVPFLLTLGAGDQLAGEATAGTFRILLTRPASRSKILAAKYLTTLLYTFTVVAFLVLLSVGLGLLLFGSGVLLVPAKVLTVIPAGEAPWRMLLACLLATWGMWTVASLAFFFSSLVDNALGPILGTMAVIIIFYVIAGIPVDLFRAVRPYLFTTYLDIWQKALESPIPWSEVRVSGAILGATSAGFYSLTWYVFIRKDILS